MKKLLALTTIGPLIFASLTTSGQAFSRSIELEDHDDCERVKAMISICILETNTNIYIGKSISRFEARAKATKECFSEDEDPKLCDREATRCQDDYDLI